MEVEVVEPMKYRLGYEESDLLSVVLGKIKSADLLAFTVNSFSWAEISKLTKNQGT